MNAVQFAVGQQVELQSNLATSLASAVPGLSKDSPIRAVIISVDKDKIAFEVLNSFPAIRFAISPEDTVKYTVPVSPITKTEPSMSKECDCDTCNMIRADTKLREESQAKYDPEEAIVISTCYNVLDRYIAYRSATAHASIERYAHQSRREDSKPTDPLLDNSPEAGLITINLAGEEQLLLDAACKRLRSLIENGPAAATKQAIKADTDDMVQSFRNFLRGSR